MSHVTSLHLPVPTVVASTEELQKLADNCIAWNDDFFTFYADVSPYCMCWACALPETMHAVLALPVTCPTAGVFQVPGTAKEPC